ncbi:hypothetical protein OTSANNIE_0029 [Anaplasma phagocytophilum str. Annie]|nr:hypothetical protein APHWEB_0654 [Anaplasma phagocytophilum str. Webster]KJV82541.1 hypothetical protein APHHGE2_0087 [Anaplasma phagocytophilum str. HGE2]KJV86509.1 hypothetical protein APHNYW_1398 [Anaplasma phagocytophilum str. ApNYW]KJV99829.1 hypothetical protein OTSANNIE_0029 [Anaplasma phagocytophilum str. Annie]
MELSNASLYSAMMRRRYIAYNQKKKVSQDRSILLDVK